tara:strand:+ start:708 stop:986 length:279 start_codon:yes stop_codon:yes gene_type:complete
MKAVWNDTVIAESDDTVVVEGNHYFPSNSIKNEYFHKTETSTSCPWKGVASYYSVTVNGKTNTDCAWYYPVPGKEAEKIKDRVAFWNGVQVI